MAIPVLRLSEIFIVVLNPDKIPIFILLAGTGKPACAKYTATPSAFRNVDYPPY
jgi:hypothetical protein